MTDWKHALLEHSPFFMAITKLNGNLGAKFNTTRVLEGLIIAGITGAITLYGVQQKMDVQIAQIQVQMLKYEQRSAEDRAANAAASAEAALRDRRIEDRINYLHAPTIGRPR